MSRKDRYKNGKDKRDGGAFVSFPLCVLNSVAYLSASPHARMLLVDLAAQYRGDNNGDLAAPFSAMQARGWRSKDTLHNAKQELVRLGLIVETRMGARPNRPTLYALTWLALDPCGNKLEIGPQVFPRGAYRLLDPLPAMGRKNAGLNPPAGLAAS